MSYIFLAGILNGLATIFLKISNDNPLLIWISLLFFSLNFLFFRSGLQTVEASSGYAVLISVSLFILLFYNIYNKDISVSISLITSVSLFIGALFYLLKFTN